MNKDWDEVKLNKLRIHELRDLARKIGVRSPTSQKKEEIIAKIMEILSGDAEPYFVEKAKGRPVRSEGQLNNLVDYFLPNELNDDLVNDKPYDEVENFRFFVNMPEAEYIGTNEFLSERVEGYVQVTATGYAILRVNGFRISNNDVYINQVFVSKYTLHTGDYIEAIAKAFYPNKPKAITKIISINANVKNNDVADFEDQAIKKNRNKFSINNNFIYLGENALILKKNNINDDDIVKFCEQLNKLSNKRVVAVYPTINNSDYTINEQSNIIYMPFSVLDDYKQVYSSFSLSFNRSKILAKCEDIIFVISGINYYYRAVSTLLSFNEQNKYVLEELTRQKLINMMLSNKSVENGSLTICNFESLHQAENVSNFIQYDLGNIVNHTIEID